jgi:ferredoxin
MTIPTSRTKEDAEINIIEDKCNGCGLCVLVCGNFTLKLENEKVIPVENPYFGCVGCGQCMAICPSDAIEIRGREISPDDLFALPDREKAATYEQLIALLQHRRSTRVFKDTPVDNELITKILDAARTAPMGLPPSDVHVLVLDSREKVRAFATDYCKLLESMKWMFSNWFITLMRPFWGKQNDEMFRGFIQPAYHIYVDSMHEGKNLVNYDAPLSMYFYGTSYSDPADPIIAATYAMVAAESLGLGTCMLGAIHPFIQSGGKAREFRERHGIKCTSKEGLFVIFGHPKVKYHKGIRRTFASVVRT